MAPSAPFIYGLLSPEYASIGADINLTVSIMQSQDRRRFSRISFDGDVHITIGDIEFDTEIVDVSLNGVLLKRPDGWQPRVEETPRVVLHGHNDTFAITMLTRVGHVEDEYIGLQCTEIDIDSITQLRRLIELNLGDSSFSNREFLELLTQRK